jgi:hypothetical protein
MSAIIAICALVGALAGIAGSAAAPSKSKSAHAQKKAAKKALKRAFRNGAGPGPGFGPGPGGAFGGPVHAEAVVPKDDGSGFVTITTDAGDLKSVDGSTLHVKEGTDKATYKDDAAITVGSDVTVIRNHAKATLSDLKAGDHVRIITGAPKGDVVVAEDDAFRAQEKKRFEQFGGRHHGPHGPPPAGAGPPGGAYPGGDKDGPDPSGSNLPGANEGGATQSGTSS